MNKERETNFRAGDVIQIVGNSGSRFAGCLMMVQEVKEWGVVAFIAVPSADAETESRYYYRARWDEFEFVGNAPWKPYDIAELEQVH